MRRKYNVLFLCRENSARSLIAEAILRELAGDRFNPFSAGDKPDERVHPLTIAELQHGMSNLSVLCPKSWLEFTGEWAPRMDIIIALDNRLDEYHAPTFPGSPLFCKWDFPDPLAEGMTQNERERSFEQVFWQILRRVSVFTELPRYRAANLTECPHETDKCRNIELQTFDALKPPHSDLRDRALSRLGPLLDCVGVSE